MMGGSGVMQEHFVRCIAGGCAKLNNSTMHKQCINVGFIDVRKQNPKQSEPLPFISHQYEAMKKDVKDMVKAFGSTGRAAHACARVG